VYDLYLVQRQSGSSPKSANKWPLVVGLETTSESIQSSHIRL
jgi:hypothetical protein